VAGAPRLRRDRDDRRRRHHDRAVILGIVVAGVALACALAYLTSLVWPPPHPFWIFPN